MVTWQDVQTTLGLTLTATQKSQATAWIRQAEIIIRARAISRHTTLEQLDPETLDYVVTEAVADRLRNPDDATQVTIQIDDGQVTKRRETATGQITIRDEWWALLFPDRNPGGAFTIPLHHRHAW